MTRRLQNRLRLQATGIEDVFQRHDVSVRVEGGMVGAEATHYRLHADTSTGWEQLRELKQDLVETLGVPDVTIRREFGELQVEVRHSSPPAAIMLELLAELAPLPPVVALLGIAEQQPLLLDLAAPETGHVLVAGEDGAGKSALLRTVALSLALHSRQAQLQLVCIAPDRQGEGSPLNSLAYLPHLMTTLITDVEDTIEVLAFLAEEIEHRQRTAITYPHVVVLLDDLDELEPRPDSKLQNSLQQLLQKGTAAGIHLVVATRPPGDTGWQRRLFQAEWPVRLTGHMAPKAAEKWGVAEASYLAGRGDFLVRSGESALRFQSAHVDDYDLQLCLEELCRYRSPSLLAQPLAPPVAQEQKKNGQPFTISKGSVTLAPRGK